MAYGEIPEIITPVNALLQQLLAAYNAVKAATTVAALVTALQQLQVAIAAVTAALALIPQCVSCKLLLYISEISSNITVALAGLVNQETIPVTVQALVNLTLQLVLCLYNSLVKLVIALDKCLCHKKKCCGDSEESDHSHKHIHDSHSEVSISEKKSRKGNTNIHVNIHQDQYQDQKQEESQDQKQEESQEESQSQDQSQSQKQKSALKNLLVQVLKQHDSRNGKKPCKSGKSGKYRKHRKH